GSAGAEASGLTISSTPAGARVWIDAWDVGCSTPVRVTGLAPGDHQVELVADGYQRWRAVVAVTLGEVLVMPPPQLVALPQ
ncbi:MAG TPA: PEGA domain-containing protein, partial [Polyangiales bacterium]|nr:PEGA domain-containing protein [Polyangiales bacterium]